MEVVGLVSGGKDSIWNLHYCAQFGHQVTCLANLAPPLGKDELDSYMYQTVGHDTVTAIADALQLPLIRRTITGVPGCTSSQSYNQQDGDEVEDLTLLLKDVLEKHPGVQAVSCGAILSNYQRLRVEDVCSRLGLKVLAFLWKQEQPHLLKQMVAGGLDARIVKVASLGLDAQHVGESILNPRFTRHLMQLGDKWGVHVCGEGGEYESVVVDAPLYQRTVCILESEKVEHEEGGDVVYLRVPKLETTAKEEQAQAPFDVLAGYSALRYYAESFAFLASPREVLAGIEDASAVTPALGMSDNSGGLESTSSSGSAAPVLKPLFGGQVLASSTLDVRTFGLAQEGTPAEQCQLLLEAVSGWLLGLEHNLREVVFAEVQVNDLGCFESMNAVYGSFFRLEPPSRVCIETPLPPMTHLRLRVLLRSGTCEGTAPNFESLRVQSISTWAMACIGPYSQAMRVGMFLFSAGVIGLIPHSMSLPSVAQASAAVSEACSAHDHEREGLDQGAANVGELAVSSTLLYPWEAELWLLMRSLRNVLLEMRSSFGEVALAQVFATNERHLAAIRDQTSAYMSRDSEIAPVWSCVVVPRLPKNGHVEVNFVCTADSQVSQSPTESVLSHPEGTVRMSSKRLASAGICVIDFSLKAAGAGGVPELCSEFLKTISGHCASEMCRELKLKGHPSDALGASVQVQFSLKNAHEIVSASMEAALHDLGVFGVCAVSYMPVLYMGESVVLRLISMSAR